MLRFGTISKTDKNKALARVLFAEDELETDWLPILQSKTLNDKSFAMPDQGEHVACLMDENAEAGVILGAIYSKKTLPGAVKGAGKIGIAFDNGDQIVYDSVLQKLKVITGTTEIHSGVLGPTMKKGSETLKVIMNDLVTQLELLTVTTAMGASGPPINVAALTAIKGRINAFFEA